MDRLLRTSPTGTIAENQPEDQMMLADDAVSEIVGVELLSGYRLDLRFSDGTARTIDFEPFLKASRNQFIRAYLNSEKFMHFRIEYGDLIWDDYELCFPIGDLYEGNISKTK